MRKIAGIFAFVLLFCVHVSAQVVPHIVWEAQATNSYIINPLAVSPDKALTASSAGQAVQVWRTTNGLPVQLLSGHAAAIVDIAFSGDGGYLASSSGDRTVRVWRTGDWSLAYSFSTTNPGPPIAFAPDGGSLAVGNGNSIELRDATNGAVFRSWTATDSFGVVALGFSPDGTKLASGAGARGMDTAVKIWNVSDGALLRTIPTAQTYNVGRVVFSPDSAEVVTGSEYLTSGPMQSWRVSDGALLHTYPVAAFAMAFSDDGSILAAAGEDITFFRAGDRSILQQFTDGFATHTPGIKGIAFGAGLFVRSRGRGEMMAARIPLGISASVLDGDHIVLTWAGGSGRYQLQRCDSLGAAWENVGDIVTTNHVMVPAISNSFFRVVDLLD